MKQFIHPEFPFPIVNSFKAMTEHRQKAVTLFGCSATVSVSKSLLGKVTVEFEFDDASETAVTTVRDTVLSLFGEPTHVGGGSFIFRKAGVFLSHGLCEKYYGSISHILEVSFARPLVPTWSYKKYQAYLNTLQAVWKSFSLGIKGIHAPDFVNQTFTVYLEHESRCYLLAIQKRSFRFYAQKKTKEPNAIRLSPIGHHKGRYRTLEALANELDAFLKKTKHD